MTEEITRLRAVRRVLLFVLVLNLAVAIAKGVYGAVSGSLAIATDAVHSLADAGNNVLGLVVVHFASAPPDHGHPYGHRKLEIVAAAGIGIIIGLAAVRFAWSAITGLVAGTPLPDTSAAGFAVVLGTLVINTLVAVYEARRARQLDSAYLAADAAHTGSDVIVTTAVLISFAAAHAGVAWADPIGALVVIAVIARVAWKIFAENVAILVDRAAVSPADVEAIALTVPGVRGCHRVRSRGTGDAVHVDLHIFLDPDMRLERAHDIAHQVEDTLRRRIPAIIDVVIHMEPEGDEIEDL